MFDVCITNAYILSTFCTQPALTSSSGRLKEFRVQLANCLIGNYNCRQRVTKIINAYFGLCSMFVSPVHTYLVRFVLNLHPHHLVDDSRNLESSLQTVSLETTTLDRELEGGVYSNSHLLPRRLSAHLTRQRCVYCGYWRTPLVVERVYGNASCVKAAQPCASLAKTTGVTAGTCGTHNSNSYLASYSLISIHI